MMKFAVNNVLVAASIVIGAITSTGTGTGTGTGRVSAHPTDDKLIQSIVVRHMLEGRYGTTRSQCKYWADPHNCVPSVCLCENGNIYAINRDNMKKGKHGCDPPGNKYPGGPCTLKASCCHVPTYYGNEDDNPVLT